jgi:hypothetical protein
MITRSLALFALLFCLSLGALHAQVRFGPKLGFATSSLEGSDVRFSGEGADELRLALKDASYSPQFGLAVHIPVGRFFIQPELLFNATTANYQLDNLTRPDTVLFREKYRYLDIPVQFGLRAGPLRLQAGPSAQFNLNNVEGISDREGWEESFDNFRLGWHGGLGLDIWKLAFDLRYEGNFNKFGDHFNFMGQDLEFSERPNRWTVSIGYMFGGN